MLTMAVDMVSVCLEFTLNRYIGHSVVGETTYNTSISTSSLDHCFRECFEDSLCYTITYSSNMCYKYGCDGNCQLASNGANDVYQRVCLEGTVLFQTIEDIRSETKIHYICIRHLEYIRFMI
ncbi:hypothetical protein DPMN_124501 [Dreissena polymorpha]|uniref:Apple domain-containing protein n=1 Tax=Dreissena polymorpha TaxID=45954 RepID=A0A9D4JSK7_DREPO|nr:hypothetical protein DPMN_124501 [Dreissena polymorpha]